MEHVLRTPCQWQRLWMQPPPNALQTARKREASCRENKVAEGYKISFTNQLL
jgi:hypothetical protein